MIVYPGPGQCGTLSRHCGWAPLQSKVRVPDWQVSQGFVLQQDTFMEGSGGRAATAPNIERSRNAIKGAV